MTNHLPRRAVSLALLALAALLSTGCGMFDQGRGRDPRVRPELLSTAPRVAPPLSRHADGTPGIVVDGDVSDWPEQTAFLADEHYLYFRFTVPGEMFTLQHAPKPVALLVDVDGSRDTGVTTNLDGLADMGIDLQVVFSPVENQRRGVVAYAVHADGTSEKLSTWDLDLHTAPTHASEWYEGRLARDAARHAAFPDAGMRSEGRGAGVAATLDADGRPDAYADPSLFDFPPLVRGDRRADAELPARPRNAVRVVSYNILRSGPVSKPDTFKRILQAVDPDVVLLQEWEDGDDAAVQGWFTALVPHLSGSWSVAKPPGDLSTGGGVVIASRYPFEGEPVMGLRAEDPQDGRAKPVRFVAARVRTPRGVVACASVHLKSRGSIGSPEDVRREAEARACNEAFAAIAEGSRARVIAGDLNLVGSRPALDVLRAGCNDGGGDLHVAQPRVLGDHVFYTWAEEDNEFARGRLDYACIGGVAIDDARAFALDTRRLSDEALARIGLDRTDSAGSDHLPLVVDLVIR